MAVDKKEAAIEAGNEAREYTRKRTRRMLKRSLDRIRQALDAELIKVFCSEGDVVESRPYVDHSTRLKAAEMVVTLVDAKPAEKLEHGVTSDLVNVLRAVAEAKEKARR